MALTKRTHFGQLPSHSLGAPEETTPLPPEG